MPLELLVKLRSVLGLRLEEVDVLVVVGRDDLRPVVVVHGAGDARHHRVSADLAMIGFHWQHRSYCGISNSFTH